MKYMQNIQNVGKNTDYVSKLSLYGKISEKHSEEINEVINNIIKKERNSLIKEANKLLKLTNKNYRFKWSNIFNGLGLKSK